MDTLTTAYVLLISLGYLALAIWLFCRRRRAVKLVLLVIVTVAWLALPGRTQNAGVISGAPSVSTVVSGLGYRLVRITHPSGRIVWVLRR